MNLNENKERIIALQLAALKYLVNIPVYHILYMSQLRYWIHNKLNVTFIPVMLRWNMNLKNFNFKISRQINIVSEARILFDAQISDEVIGRRPLVGFKSFKI